MGSFRYTFRFLPFHSGLYESPEYTAVFGSILLEYFLTGAIGQASGWLPIPQI